MRTQKTNSHPFVHKGFLAIFITGILACLVQAQSPYYLTVKTGDKANAGTNAIVFAKLKGSRGGESEWIKLNKKRLTDFQRNSTQVYSLGRHGLRGNVQVRFAVLSNNTIDESWYLEWLNVGNRYRSKIGRSSRLITNKWVLPRQSTPFYFTRLKGTLPIGYRPYSDLDDMILVPRGDGSFVFRRKGSYTQNTGYKGYVLVPGHDGTYRRVARRNGSSTDFPFTNSPIPKDSVSERTPRNQGCPRFTGHKTSDGVYRIVNECTGRLLNEVSPQVVDKSGFNPSGQSPKVYFENRTDRQVEIYRVENGRERLYDRLRAGSRGIQSTSVNQRWRIKSNGRSVGDYIATGNRKQNIVIRNPAATISMEIQR